MRKITHEASFAFLNFESVRLGNTITVVMHPSRQECQMHLFHNKIAVHHGKFDRIDLFDGGHQTQTTKDRLNGVLEMLGSELRIIQKNFTWYLRNTETGELQEFENGFSVHY